MSRTGVATFLISLLCAFASNDIGCEGSASAEPSGDNELSDLLEQSELASDADAAVAAAAQLSLLQTKIEHFGQPSRSTSGSAGAVAVPVGGREVEAAGGIAMESFVMPPSPLPLQISVPPGFGVVASSPPSDFVGAPFNVDSRPQQNQPQFWSVDSWAAVTPPQTQQSLLAADAPLQPQSLLAVDSRGAISPPQLQPQASSAPVPSAVSPQLTQIQEQELEHATQQQLQQTVEEIPVGPAVTAQVTPSDPFSVRSKDKFDLAAADPLRSADSAALNAATANIPPATNMSGGRTAPCAPQCFYKCQSQTCDEVCRPVCRPATCELRCQSPDVSQCVQDCSEPDCRIDCPKRKCTTVDCQHCETKCSSPTCRLRCPEKQSCQTVCEQPECSFQCRAPARCPAPTCQMVCQHPDGCKASTHVSLPPLQLGETRVHSFQVSHEQAALINQGHAAGFEPSEGGTGGQLGMKGEGERDRQRHEWELLQREHLQQEQWVHEQQQQREQREQLHQSELMQLERQQFQNQQRRHQQEQIQIQGPADGI